MARLARLLRPVLGGALAFCCVGLCACARRPSAVPGPAAGLEAFGVDQGQQRATRQRGEVLLVAYRDGVIELRPDCHVRGVYTRRAEAVGQGRVSARVTPALRSELSFLQPAFAARDQVDVTYAISGRLVAAFEAPRAEQLQGPSCEGVTHYVESAEVGAFGWVGLEQGRGVYLPGAGEAGISLRPEQIDRMLVAAGDRSRCGAGGQPQEVCDALVRVSLASVDRRKGLSGRQELTIVSAAVGGVGVLVGVVGAAVAISNDRESLGYCNPADSSACTARGVELRENARSYANVATIGAAVGAIGLGGALVLLLTDERSGAVGVSLSADGAAVKGRF